MSDDRPIVYREADKWIFRASAVGSSIRELAAAMLGYEPLPAPDYLMAAAAAGNAYELVVKAMLRDQGHRISGEQSQIEIPVGDDAVIRGHLDSWHIVDEDNTDRILEIKSMSESVFARWVRSGFDSFPEYAAQVTCYMEGAGGRPAVYATINRDTNQLLTRILDEPPVPFTEVADRVLRAVQAADEGVLPTCDRKSPYMCPYHYLCDFPDVQVEKLQGESESILARLGLQYNQARIAEKLASARKSELAEQIKQTLGSRSHVSAGSWVFNCTELTRKKLNEAALRGELGARLDEFYTETSYKRLLVKETKPA